ncbi:MAG: PQQ-binding-like beta-propeller repeat protein, partial [Planctomycetia bacterium]|nr:PQQ-binding-like beta-propeller repeat protein [Planctomycetia bacterium]
WKGRPTVLCLAAFSILLGQNASADDWPRWRGSDGSAVSRETGLPEKWSATDNVRWRAEIKGEGSSSPIVVGECVFVTSAEELGARRSIHCLDRATGKTRWSRTIEHDDPEVASSLTGHAASTPACDGKRVVAWFGRAGLFAWDLSGKQLWHVEVGELESELGFASSPIFYGDLVILVCDHDGDRFRSQDSFLLAVDAATGKERYKIARDGLFRSWSTPILVPVGDDRVELVVAAQDEVRAYQPKSGELLWRVTVLTSWVTPSPVFADGLLFATSGRSGPLLAIRPGGTGDVTKTHVAWSHATGGPYVCSPVAYDGHLYVHDETGVLSCFEAKTGKLRYRERLEGKFYASPIAGDGKLYATNEEGTTYVVKTGDKFELLATNRLEETCLASPAIAGKCLFVRTNSHIWCIGPTGEKESPSR